MTGGYGPIEQMLLSDLKDILLKFFTQMSTIPSLPPPLFVSVCLSVCLIHIHTYPYPHTHTCIIFPFLSFYNTNTASQRLICSSLFLINLVFLSLSLSLSYTHRDTHAHIHTHICKHTQSHLFFLPITQTQLHKH